jgi:hypothetical protein
MDEFTAEASVRKMDLFNDLAHLYDKGYRTLFSQTEVQILTNVRRGIEALGKVRRHW